jgi:hypothetical protein
VACLITSSKQDYSLGECATREIRRRVEFEHADWSGAGGRSACPSTGKEETTQAISCATRSRTDEVCSIEQPDSKSGQRTYDHAINEFVDWYCSEPRLAFNRTVVLRYRIHLEQRHLAPTTINLRLAAVRRVAYEAADAASSVQSLPLAFAESRAYAESECD